MSDSGQQWGDHDVDPEPIKKNRDQRLFDALSLTPRHQSEVSPMFLRAMAARMAMSMEKYGKVVDFKMDAVECANLRIKTYLETGNTEYLIDAANFLQIEFMKPREGAFFSATDTDGSPGRVTTDGRVTHAANTLSHENVRRGGSNLRTDGGFYKGEGD